MRKSPAITLPLFVGVVLFLVMLACALPGMETTSPAEPKSLPTGPEALPPVESPTAADSPAGLVDVEPVAGSTIKWFDFSEFVYVPDGEFVMGRNRPEGGDDTPAHTVLLGGFWIHQAEVTNQQYAACVLAGECAPPARYPKIPYWFENPAYANAPVTGVNWEQAATYCAWIDARLPSEAEWEKAAHGPALASDSQALFPWGDQEPACDLLNFNNCLEPSQPVSVRTYAAGISPFKLLDTSGNAFEWVQDWYARDYYQISPLSNPTGPDTGTLRVYRGGGYDSPPAEVRPDARFALEPQKHTPNLGFRCVLLGIAPPPMCEVPVFDDTPNPSDTDWGFDAVAYCEDRGKDQRTGVNIQINMPADELDDYSFTVSASGIPLTCVPYAPDRLGCYGSPLSQNTNVEIEVCRNFTGLLLAPSPTCPDGYFYNPDTETCDHTLPMPGEGGECPHGYVFTEVGCVPRATGTECPAGLLYLDRYGICWPTSRCMIPVWADDPECPRECWDGFTYNPDEDCCETDSPLPFCPPGFTYASARYCRPQSFFGHECKTKTVYVPACPTPTPPPPPDQCYCCQFTSQSTCNAQSNNGCWWIVLGSTAYCSGP